MQRVKAGLIDYFCFAVVGAYLSFAMLCLLVSGKLDPGVTLGRLVKGALRRRVRGELCSIHAEKGFCYVAAIPIGSVSDSEGRSRVTLCEDGAPLGPAHCPHTEIREKGGGRYSHWGQAIYFSTSDNSDPTTNGRSYTFAE